MKRKHKTLMTIGVLALAAGWFAWTVLLTESEIEEPSAVEQAP